MKLCFVELQCMLGIDSAHKEDKMDFKFSRFLLATVLLIPLCLYTSKAQAVGFLVGLGVNGIVHDTKSDGSKGAGGSSGLIGAQFENTRLYARAQFVRSDDPDLKEYHHYSIGLDFVTGSSSDILRVYFGAFGGIVDAEFCTGGVEAGSLRLFDTCENTQTYSIGGQGGFLIQVNEVLSFDLGYSYTATPDLEIESNDPNAVTGKVSQMHALNLGATIVF